MGGIHQASVKRNRRDAGDRRDEAAALIILAEADGEIILRNIQLDTNLFDVFGPRLMIFDEVSWLF